MRRTPTLRRLLRAWRLAEHCEATRTSTREALARRDERLALSRRDALKLAGLAAVAASPAAAAVALSASPRIAIVGGGLAGLVCADRLQAKGVGNGGSTAETADAVVLALPFTVLRGVVLDPSLGVSADKLRAIATLGYGTNAKTMVAFEGRPWEELHGSGGGAYSDLPSLQCTWETNRARASRFGIITDYASGERGATLRPSRVQTQVGDFLQDFDTALPGVAARASTDRGRFVAHLEHWPSNPLTLGSYTCYMPGQFTSIAGLEGQPAGLVKFAGEHADSFYSWQGYMEGACLSGLRAANELLADIKSGAL
jgi:monoamine oxidase